MTYIENEDSAGTCPAQFDIRDSFGDTLATYQCELDEHPTKQKHQAELRDGAAMLEWNGDDRLNDEVGAEEDVDERLVDDG